MRWNKSEYSDIQDIRLPPARLWKPDILMYNRSVSPVTISPDIDLTSLVTTCVLLVAIRLASDWLWWFVVMLHLIHDPTSNINSCLLGSNELR